MRKVILFASDMYDRGANKKPGIYNVREDIQERLDKWCRENPSFVIENTSIALTKEEALLSVVYTIEAPPFGTIK